MALPLVAGLALRGVAGRVATTAGLQILGGGAKQGGVRFSVDPSLMRRLQLTLKHLPGRADKVIVRALNRAADSARTQAKRIIAKELGVKQSTLTKPHRFGATKGQSTGVALRVIGANEKRMFAILRVSGRRIPLIFFKAREYKGKRTRFTNRQGTTWRQRTRGSGVKYRIGSRGTKRIDDAFIGRARAGRASSASESASGHKGVFSRSGKARLPIHELKGPSIPHVARKNRRFRNHLETVVPRTLADRLNREIARQLERLTKERAAA